MNVYFISGLGADEQMFQRIRLPEGYTIIHLPWLEPYEEENFAIYAKRLLKGIDNRSPFIIIGLSLGGMMAIEINKVIEPALIILISSATSEKALPWWFKLAALSRVYELIPDYFYHHRTFISSWLLGAKSKEDKALLSKVMANASPVFVRWAIPRILNWENRYIPQQTTHLHGTADVILPYRKETFTIPIQGGTHFMVFNRAADINQELSKILHAE